jgi:hypothetical protein
MTEHNELQNLLEIIRDEEIGNASATIGGRIAAIEQMPDGPVRARLCAAAFLTASYQMATLLEGNEATARQLRRLADMLDADGKPSC